MNTSDDEEILAAARAGFLDEAVDMLRQYEAALLVMETDPTNEENLNAAFRAAHTIKGTAGLFGFEAVVAFTHGVETLMEALRSETLAANEEIIALLLQSGDQMAQLLDEVGTGENSAEVAERSIELGVQLAAMTGIAPPAAAMAKAAAADALSARAGCWHISLRFGADALRNGLDPLSFIRYLNTLGKVRHIRTLERLIPALESLDAEGCQLGFEIRFESEASREAIEQVFEFVVEDCQIDILAPDAASAAFHELLQKRCGEDAEEREALLDLWQEQGVHLTTREELIGETEEDVLPAVERREDAQDRRHAEPERRAAPKDRRGGEETRFIRVRADKLDALIDLIGELVIAGSGAQLVANRENSPSFQEAAQRVASLVEAARDSALGLRMVPIGETFARFHRVVRDISKSLGKEVSLEITGGDTELDKSMVETIADPLMHLVRNSLDHGLESTDQRDALGKNPTGRLALHAYHESGQVMIEVSDDGRGLNRQRILNKAIERGIVSPDQELSDAEVNALIFAPGFSTAEKITEVSGRGVGMDVVKRNIEALRGQIHIASTEGRGTTIQIRLPLTLAIIDGFLSCVSGVHYVVPLEAVVECIETPQACRTEGSRTAERTTGCFDLRGEVLPFVDLRSFFRHEDERPVRQSMIIVRTERVKVGLLVDRLLGEHQTVIKPLGRVFQHLKGIAGSTILGSGEVALVLNVPGLVAGVARTQGPRLVEPMAATAQAKP
jgi:two-component system, chemotaxis family, sensor kinase CheA